MKADIVVKKLIDKNKTIAFMESCTSGYVASSLTNVENASKVLKFSAVTYSNEFKIKMGVEEAIIDKYSVYSIETAKDMSLKISKFAKSDYGVGVTGKLKKQDENNPYGSDNIVYVSIYDRENDKYYTCSIEVMYDTREQNKSYVASIIFDTLCNII